jgi:hypothetical protein
MTPFRLLWETTLDRVDGLAFLDSRAILIATRQAYHVTQVECGKRTREIAASHGERSLGVFRLTGAVEFKCGLTARSISSTAHLDNRLIGASAGAGAVFVGAHVPG